jgi:NTE family protein
VLEDRLRAIPFLRDLPSATIERAAARLRPVSVPRDELVFSAGDPADSLFLVERGWLEVTEPGTNRMLASLGPGSVVGELGILLDAPRAASVRAIGEAELWELRRADVEAIVADDPSLAVALSREIGRRLLAANRADGIAPRLVVLPAPGVARLATALVDAGVGVSVLELTPVPDLLPPAAERLGTEHAGTDGVMALATTPAEGRSVVLVSLPPDHDPVAETAARAAEFGVAEGGSLPRWVVDEIEPLRRLRGSTSDATLARTARWVSGRAIGLALSSGGSKTLAHMGVFKVLRAAGVPIDAVSGTSGGSVGAAIVARDIPDPEITTWIRQIAPAFRWLKLGPKMPPRDALFSGAGPLGLFRAWHGDRRIERCELPLYVIAADLASGAEVVLDRGSIADALRASMSIPGVLEPPRWHDRFLVDGGIVSPLPARVLRDAGIQWVVGSNVAGQESNLGTDVRPPHLVETMGRMLSTMERSLLSNQIALLDVHIRPIVRAANSFDFSNPDPLFAEGVRAAREQLPAVERLVEMAARA